MRQEIFPLRQNINPQFLAPARSNLVAGLGPGLGRIQSAGQEQGDDQP